MKRPAVLFGFAALLFATHAAAGLAGWAEHTSAIAGMPTSPASFVLGPAFVLLHLVVVVLAPVLTIAAMLDALLVLRRQIERGQDERGRRGRERERVDAGRRCA